MRPPYLVRTFGIAPLAAFALLALHRSVSGADDPAMTLRVLERGPNHSVVQRITTGFHPIAGWLSTTSSWHQLEDGLNYFDPDLQAWAESREEIELTPLAAVARHGQHRAVFSPNVNDPEGALDVEIQHQVRLRSSVLALRYFDPASGRDALVATVQDARGELLPPNQVLYRDAFDAVKADMLYTLRKSGIEADLVLRQIPPSPAEFGLPVETTRLEVVTEIFEAPAPTRRSRLLATVDDPALRAAVAEPDWVDEELDFGVNRLVAGRAFAWSAREAARARPEEFPPVAKRWFQTRDGRTLLVESVEYIGLLDDLAALPGRRDRIDEALRTARAWAGSSPVQIRRQGFQRWAAAGSRPLPTASFPGRLPGRPLATLPRSEPHALLIAHAPAPATTTPGVVIDWTSLTAGSSNMTFRGDLTYLVTGNCYFRGSTTLEGGAVFKFPPFTNEVYTSITHWDGSFRCLTSAYRPAVFTAHDDNSVGETIVAGSPNPDMDYAWVNLRFYDSATPILAQHLRLKHGHHGIYFVGNNPSNVVRHCQFVNNMVSVRDDDAKPVKVQNCLLDVGRYPGIGFYSWSGQRPPFSIVGENLTLHRAPTLLVNGNLTLTNSLLVGVTNVQTFYGANNYVVTTVPTGTFETVGAGAFYLPSGSPHRNAGLGNIDPVLAQDLRRLTTWAPLILTNPVTTATTLEPRAPRDWDLPDLGYHYPPLDYAVAGLAVSNAVLRLNNGVALAAFGTNGITLLSGAALESSGLPDRLNRLVRFHTVQEGSTNWSNPGASFALLRLAATSAPYPAVNARFTEFSHMAVGTNASATTLRLAALGGGSPPSTFRVQDCLIRGLHLNFQTALPQPLSATLCNNLFECAQFSIHLTLIYGQAQDIVLRNNLFRGGWFEYINSQTNLTCLVADNFFDTSLSRSEFYSQALTAFNNGYAAGLSPLRSTGERTNVVPNYATGPLGPYYYPTNAATNTLTGLLDAGSRTANLAGLYHHTLRADLARESNSVVDIGFHYPATDASGNPIDTDGDGIADVVEDANGNGSVDSDETDWNVPNGAPSGPAGLTVFTPLR
jgi:hypothetical protein